MLVVYGMALAPKWFGASISIHSGLLFAAQLFGHIAARFPEIQVGFQVIIQSSLVAAAADDIHM